MEAGEAGLCRFVQLAMIRLLGNTSIMVDHAVSPAVASNLLEELLADERLDFAGEPPLLDSVLPTLLRHAVGNAYLAAFAMASSRRMVTLDGGFRQFKGLDVELLGG